MTNFDIVALYDELSALDANLAETNQQRENLLSQVKEYYKDDIAARYKAKKEPYGTASIEDSGVTVKFDVPKYVKWDQGLLAEIYQRIKDEGGDPEHYIKIKYDVSEKTYNALTEKQRSIFDAARTVSDGKTKIELLVK